MQTPSTKRVALAMLLFAGSTAGYADVIFGDLAFDDFNVSFASGVGINYVAAPFVLQEGQSTITDIHWLGMPHDAGGDGSFAEDSFLVAIYGDATGLPDMSDVLFERFDADVTRTFAGLYPDAVIDIPYYLYSMRLEPLALEPGTTYHLMIVNTFESDLQSGNLVGNDMWLWFYDLYSPPYEYYVSYGGPDNWGIVPGDAAFQLTNDIIPEPAGVTLLGAGLAALAWVHRWRKDGLSRVHRASGMPRR